MSDAGRRSTWLVLGSLLVGLFLGALSAQAGEYREPLVQVASTVGGLWLDALKMTVIPLIIALLVTGIVSGADQARAGGIAGRSYPVVRGGVDRFGGIWRACHAGPARSLPPSY